MGTIWAAASCRLLIGMVIGRERRSRLLSEGGQEACADRDLVVGKLLEEYFLRVQFVIDPLRAIRLDRLRCGPALAFNTTAASTVHTRIHTSTLESITQ